MSSDSTGGEGPKDTPRFDPFATAMERTEQSWAASLDMLSAITNSWQSMLRNRGIPAVQAMVNQITNPDAWPGGLAPLAQELQDILALPRFADLPAPSLANLPSPAAAVELMAVAQQYLLATAPVWAKACQRFQAEVTARQKNEPGALDSAGDAMDVWNNVLDQTLMEFNRSAEFTKMQQRFLRAAMLHRQEVRKVGELFAQSIGLPTRTEMDDIYRRLHDLLREVHGLRRELRAIRRGASEQTKATASARKGRRR